VNSIARLSNAEYKRLSICPVTCPKMRQKIQSLADYFSVLSTAITTDNQFWFRGHASAGWNLTPSALRYATSASRTKALKLLDDFKRVAEIKLDRPPRQDEELKWIQLAQHHGIPTRLLDWTESATIALYFACLEPAIDGLVFLLNPIDLNRRNFPKKPWILDAQSDAATIGPYLKLTGKKAGSRRNTIAINPVWNSARLMLQKGVFTLHGSHFALDSAQVPSLVALPIMRDAKEQLRKELERIGVDEMTIFPELEHAARHLCRRVSSPAQE
jgi:FRG domain